MEDTQRPSASRPTLAAGISDDALLEINRLWTVVRAFSNTAHDVNNALQVIAGSAELLELRDLEPGVRTRVETVRVEAAKAALLIERLLAYARQSAPQVQSLDLRAVVEWSVELRLASAGHRRIALSVDREGQAPCIARGDAVRLQQALLDLLLAAERHLDRRRNARIVVRVGREGGMAAVSVTASSLGDAGPADTGPPSSADALTIEAELWAAAHLAAAQQGRLTVAASGEALVLTLSVPAG